LLHPTVVNVMFCDGHGQTLSEAIDFAAYAAWLTPTGVRYGQTAIGDESY
jgi:prepilin-type processing-associated H-X9-DG protein